MALFCLIVAFSRKSSASAGAVVAAIFADRAAGSCHPRVFSAVLAGEGAMAWELRSDDA